MTAATDPFLGALLSSLLPGNGEWPPAADTGVPVWFGERVGVSPDLADAVDWLRTSLPTDFALRTPAQRVADLRAAEVKDAMQFSAVISEAFSGYYIDPAVLGVIERKTGFPARPPQPLGHRLEPFDSSVLDGRKRPASGR